MVRRAFYLHDVRRSLVHTSEILCFAGDDSLTMEMDGFAASGGLTGGVEDFGDDDVGVERAEAGGLQIVEDDGAEIVDGIVFGGGDRTCVDQLLVLLCEADADVVAFYGDGVAGFAIDLHIFAIEGPIPRGLQNRVRFRIGEDDGGLHRRPCKCWAGSVA